MDKKYTITKIIPQKRNNKRVSIYLNGEYAFSLSLEVILKSNLEEGQIITKKYIENILKKEEEIKAKKYGLKLISNRPRSTKEITDKMKEKGYDPDIIEKTINYLNNFGYLDDYEYAKEYIQKRSKKFGSNRIKMELLEKGIKRETITELLSEELDDDYEYQRALEIAERKMKSLSDGDKQTLYRKLGGHLQRKGFDYSIINRVLDKLLFNNG